MIASSQSSSDPQTSPTQGGESGEAKPSERWRKILRWTPSVAAGLLIEKRYARQSEFEAVGGQSAVKCTLIIQRYWNYCAPATVSIQLVRGINVDRKAQLANEIERMNLSGHITAMR